MESIPLNANGGLFFARGDKDPKTGRNRLLARWVLGEFLRRQHETFRDPTVGWRKMGEGVNPQIPMEAGSSLSHVSLDVTFCSLHFKANAPTEVVLRVVYASDIGDWRKIRYVRQDVLRWLVIVLYA